MAEDLDLDTAFDEDESHSGPRWSFPDIAAIAILGALSVVVVGGVISGFLEYNSVHYAAGPPVSDQLYAAAIQTGAGWADPLWSVAMLAVIAIMWWPFRRQDTPVFEDEWESPGGVIPVSRYRTIVVLAEIGLGVVVAATISDLVASFLIQAGSEIQTHAGEAGAAANCAANLVLTLAGLVGGARVFA